MEQRTVRKTYKYKLTPTPEQERELGHVLGLCRYLYNTALEQRMVAYQRRHVSLSRYQQEAELKDIRVAMPEYAAIHSHVLQDVLARLDKTYQAFFRRMKVGEKAGFPRYQARTRWHSFTYKEFGKARHWTTASSSCRRLGVLPCGGLAPWKAHLRRSRSVGKQMVGMSVSPAPTHPYNHSPQRGKRPG